MKNEIKLLDCTLRDGGYINNWFFGKSMIDDVVKFLVCANIDIIELGFLRNEENDVDRTVWNELSRVQDLVEKYSKKVSFSVMILHDKYDICKLEPREQTGVEYIRITFHDFDFKEGLSYANQVKALGYKVCCNPINIMGYNEKDLFTLIDMVNEIEPYAFSVVDTFGSMDSDDLDKLISLCNVRLKKSIALGLHLHENKSQSFQLAQQLIQKQLHREIIIDGSLEGMGRVPGNLPIELISDYLNKKNQKNYEIDYLLEAIELYINPIKVKSNWGYSPVYFLSAKYNLHRNYAEYLLGKGNLTHKDINHILYGIPDYKKTKYDEKFIEEMYLMYMENDIDDTKDKETLFRELDGRNVLVLAPGKSLLSCNEEIDTIIRENKPIIISVNFIPQNIRVDYAFFTNAKRLLQYESFDVKRIVTSNLSANNCYILNRNRLMIGGDYGDNSLVMLLKFLRDSNSLELFLAGADGYTNEALEYCESRLHSFKKGEIRFNQKMKTILSSLHMDINFVTPSAYQ